MSCRGFFCRILGNRYSPSPWVGGIRSEVLVMKWLFTSSSPPYDEAAKPALLKNSGSRSCHPVSHVTSTPVNIDGLIQRVKFGTWVTSPTAKRPMLSKRTPANPGTGTPSSIWRHAQEPRKNGVHAPFLQFRLGFEEGHVEVPSNEIHIVLRHRGCDHVPPLVPGRFITGLLIGRRPSNKSPSPLLAPNPSHPRQHAGRYHLPLRINNTTADDSSTAPTFPALTAPPPWLSTGT